ncbi:hypothetical protein D3P07_16430 [Paenibacillus sp. 1011MAR3C5]|uniref:hypothetical protein n=1 Tax=Paenibacillus sp. 1011MAR3C5 TaxID=1675787 RepID=UPI000E6B70E0|nr:hypothetical protein [Paenibacillus sp. 1011MAR3C5]RJE86776.1 hypothetical protein D3P07_16430 [Paenibacillus sp. 1011MAR3C5]
MQGTWRWNVVFGLTGVVLTVLFSIGNNPLSVIMLRSLYAFIAFFALAYPARFLMAFILKPPAMIGDSQDSDETKGSSLDMTTPDEGEDLNELLKAQMQGSNSAEVQEQKGVGNHEAAPDFRPLTPPQFVSATNKQQPEDLAKALRHLTGE